MRLQTLFLAATLVASSTSAFAGPFTQAVRLRRQPVGQRQPVGHRGCQRPGPGTDGSGAALRARARQQRSRCGGVPQPGARSRAAAYPRLLGGTNFAVIGAATGNVPLPGGGTADNIAATLDSLPPGLVLPATGMLNAQLAQFFSMNPGPIDPNALFLIWGGPNDLAINPSAACRGGGRSQHRHDDRPALRSRRAETSSYRTWPISALTPGIAGSPLAPLVSGLSGVFNTALTGQLDSRSALPGISITRFSTFNFFNMVVASPGTYGFTNVEDACYTGPLLGLGARRRVLHDVGFAPVLGPEPSDDRGTRAAGRGVCRRRAARRRPRTGDRRPSRASASALPACWSGAGAPPSRAAAV